jgi:DNA-binding response OmpR family regulator
MGQFIFIVEDDLDLRFLYEKILKLKNYHVESAGTGSQAIKKLSNINGKGFPDIILMDYRLPDIDGIETMERIFQLQSSAKVVFLSADDTIRDKVISKGAKAFFKKPNSVISLVNIIKTMLDEN